MAKKRKNKKKKKKKKKEKKDAIQEGEIELLGRTDEQPRPSQGSNGNSGHVVIQMFRVRKDLLSVLDHFEDRCKEFFDKDEKLQKPVFNSFLHSPEAVPYSLD